MKHTLTLSAKELAGSLLLTWLKAPCNLLAPVKNRISLILFCGGFSFLFMYIFSPFNMNQWYEGGPQTVTGVFGIFSLCGVTGLTLSQFGLIRFKGNKPLSHLQFIAWFLGEAMLIAIIVNIVNVSMHDYLQYSWSEYTDTLKYAFGVMVLPYSMAMGWFYVGQLKNQTTEKEKDSALHIRDEYDKLTLTLAPSNLLLLKAEDNYVHIFYLNGTVVKKELIRSSLKKLEPQLSGLGFSRSHRSYMVNLSRVILFKKNAKGHYLLIDGLEDVTIPVSTSYLSDFLQRFTPAC
ncbi:LytR/AlgR family response regulator transcription factor [Chitinophaga niabensis]|uniref:LytTr DNA-binding domain-containing protein n=1 Tax=Chitinophaga niabensis TaxID=536979 RepID=A0A1N6DGP2_9BACT|nr:LytTR family DNA-binding domain-containing protein [Chitinophaga niabensis]SIN69853.1 LytTr DNA-binding domain-containing protein [Chitinophaga niabensis]